MTYTEEQQLIREIRENNVMLKQIIAYINLHGNHTDDAKEFTMNVIANLISEKFKV